jgi:DNA-binding NarL/FixJ family response regulator
MSIRVLIADDHAVFRSGLRALLEKERDIEIVVEAGDGFEAVRAASDSEVDVVILDLGMPGLPGARVAEMILENKPRLAIVVLTMHEDEYYLRELLKVGVRAFVLKKSTGTDLLQAIRMAYRGEEYVDTALAGRMISSFIRPQNRSKNSGRLGLLTPREREVCSLLAYGNTNVEIAKQLFISERTVESHRASCMAKLELKSRAELVRFAIENGLLRIDSP